MAVSKIRSKGKGRALLMAGLILLGLSTDLPAREQRGEFGINGGVFGMDGRYVAWPGFVLDVGTWQKGWGLEGLVFFLAYIPVAFGGDVLICPFRASKVVPFFSVGAMAAANIMDSGGQLILEAGAGLKIAMSRTTGIRMEYRRYFYKEAASRWEQANSFSAGFYFTFGKKR